MASETLNHNADIRAEFLITHLPKHKDTKQYLKLDAWSWMSACLCDALFWTFGINSSLQTTRTTLTCPCIHKGSKNVISWKVFDCRIPTDISTSTVYCNIFYS